MKKLTLIIAAFALLIGFSQCKKDEITPTENENRIHITLNANFGGGDRTGFNPASGQFDWSHTIEYINVGGKKSGYIGQLQSTWTEGFESVVFSGDITPAADEEMLYFFYLGNGGHAGATTLDFSNQYGDLDRITNWHIAIGSAPISSSNNYSATLDMAMAIAYFDLSGFTSNSNTAETVYIHGDDMYSTATIDYYNGTITGNSKGFINVGTANAGKYVALIPSVNTETVLQFDSNNKTGSMTFLRGIQAGKYYSDGDNALSMTVEAGSGIPGTFSVSATKKVFFSKGNLQYQASTGTWRFAEHQYDYVGDATNGNVYVNEVKSNNANIASDYTGWIDLFGWGTSGYNDKYPYMSSTTSSDYYSTGDITGTQYDWGVFNSSKITNGEGYFEWRTLAKEEWAWLIGASNEATSNCRTTKTSGLSGTNNTTARFTKATVNGVPGLIIFPDVYTQPSDANVTYSNTCYNSYYSQYATFTVSLDGWNKMEDAGAVFLPASGYREGTTVNVVNTYAYYWSSTKNSNTNSYKLYFYNNGLNPQTTSNYPNYTYNYSGHAVRLVRE